MASRVFLVIASDIPPMRPGAVFTLAALAAALAVGIALRLSRAPAPGDVRGPLPSHPAVGDPPPAASLAVAESGGEVAPPSTPAGEVPSGRTTRGARRAERAAARDELDRAAARALVAETIPPLVTERSLTDADVDRLTDDVLRIRAARRALAALRPSARNAQALRAWRARLDAALADFQAVAGVSAVELGERAAPADGLTGEEPAGAEIVHEPLANYPPPR